VHLVDEEYGLAVVQLALALGGLDGVAYGLDAGAPR